MEFKDRIRRLRKSRKYTQFFVANCMGITERQYQRLEYGLAEPRLTGLVILAGLYDVSVDYLVGLSEEAC